MLITAQQQSPRNNNPIKVVVNGAASDLGKAAILAITRARNMALAGAVDSHQNGRDAGELAGLEEPLELPVMNDLVMVLGSLSQSTQSGVMVDFTTNLGQVYENVRQATAFGLKSVVCSPDLDEEVVGGLITFCEKASTGCVICPTLSIGRVLLQQAAIQAAFHYGAVQIIEASGDDSGPVPSSEATSFAQNLSGLGRIYNEGAQGKDAPARGAMVGDNVRVHSLLMPGPGLSSMDVRLSGPGEALSLKHEIGNVSALMPGLLLAIRRVVRLKSLVYGLEKIL
jgi:chloroplast NAD(P)H dehydrogenase